MKPNEPFAAPLFYAASELIVASNALDPTRVDHEWGEEGTTYEGDCVDITENAYRIRVAEILNRAGGNLPAALPHGLSIRAESEKFGDLITYLGRYGNSYHFSGAYGLYELALKRIQQETANLSRVPEPKKTSFRRLSALWSYVL
jgi:hypothetical protein